MQQSYFLVGSISSLEMTLRSASMLTYYVLKLKDLSYDYSGTVQYVSPLLLLYQKIILSH